MEPIPLYSHTRIAKECEKLNVARMATCPACGNQVRPVKDPAAIPRDTEPGIAAATWVCPECDAILGVSEVNLLSSTAQWSTEDENSE